MPNGIVQSSWTDPTQTTAHLVIVLESRIQKSGTGDNNFVKWKGTFRSNRPKWPDCSKRSTFKAGSEYSSWTKSKWSFPLKSTNWNLWNFGLNGKHHWLPPFLLINLLLSVFKKLFQCYIQEGKHKAGVIGPRASTYSAFPQQSWKINRYEKPNSKSGAVFSSVRDSSCPWCPPILQCNFLIIYKCFGCNRYYAVGEVVVTSKEELAIAQQSLIEV